MAEASFALSVKQPWAALLVHGRKSIEVRRWPTARRGRILIHASRIADPRPEVWDLLPPELHKAALLRGGIIGAGDLTGCLTYKSVAEFAADRWLHLNDPSWFQKPFLYGFVFTHLVPVEFRPYPGWVRFFRIDPPA
jgi:hypothetical protein